MYGLSKVHMVLWQNAQLPSFSMGDLNQNIPSCTPAVPCSTLLQTFLLTTSSVCSLVSLLLIENIIQQKRRNQLTKKHSKIKKILLAIQVKLFLNNIKG